MPSEGSNRFELHASHFGPVRIWQPPGPGQKFVMAADASAGGINSDFAAACVIETASCDLVAGIKCKRDPVPFGRMCAMLAWHFNDALLAFEVWPSAHGASANAAARDMNYPMLYRRAQNSTVHMKVTDEYGWATTEKTKPYMLNAVREAIAAGCRIPWRALVQQIDRARLIENDRLEIEGDNDDIFVSYAIALLVRRHAVASGFVTDAKAQYVDERAAWWQHRNRQLDSGGEAADESMVLNDGS